MGIFLPLSACRLSVDPLPQTDPGEHIDLAKNPQFASTLAKLQARAKALDLTAIEAIKPVGWRGQNNQSLACEVMQKNGGFWGPTQPK